MGAGPKGPYHLHGQLTIWANHFNFMRDSVDISKPINNHVFYFLRTWLGESIYVEIVRLSITYLIEFR